MEAHNAGAPCPHPFDGSTCTRSLKVSAPHSQWDKATLVFERLQNKNGLCDVH